MKKKLILMLCVAALTLSFASCGDTDKGSKDTESAASSAAAAESEAETESKAEAESAAETESAAAEESAAETTESKADENKPAASDNAELTDLLAKVKETTADSKNCEVTANMDIDMVMTMNGSTTNMKNTTEIVSKTNGKNTHTIQTTSTDQGTGPITETQESYQSEDGNTYVTTDEGKTWTKTVGSASTLDTDAFSSEIIGDESVFQNATLEKDGDKYVITISLNDILASGGEVAESLFGMGGGGTAEGNMIMTIGSDYYPVSISMENISFDMSELISSLSSEDTGDMSMDMKMNMVLNFSNWGGVSDADVAVPEAALSAE
jgi:hypothetical protein